MKADIKGKLIAAAAKIICTLAIIAAIFFGIRKIAGAFRTERMVRCSKSVLTEIKNECKYIACTSRSEYVKVYPRLFFDNACFIYDISMQAGYDFDKFDFESDLAFDNNEIIISLPEEEVFDPILNPTDIEAFHGTMSFDREKLGYSNVLDEAVSEAIEDGLLKEARESASESISSTMKALGFETVTFVYSDGTYLRF